MKIRDNNNNKTIITKDNNQLEENSRFCKSCHLGLVKKLTGVYSCPRCNCSVIKQDSYPTTKLRTTFPTFNQYESIKTHVMQSEDQKLPRSKLYFKRKMEEKNELEDQDPYLTVLKNRGDLHLTNVEYFAYSDDDDDDDDDY